VALAPDAPPPATAEDRLPALLAALRAGLQAPQLRLDRLTPELMHLIGRLLHECARGTVDLLVARAAQKREVSAEATLIVTRENNPLKFSPNAEVALQHLLSPTLSGFMTPVAALRDAHDDLSAHQSGCIAGLRAALAGVFARFEPAALERRLGPPSGLHLLLPARRKAALWDAFVAHHAQTAADAGQGVHGPVGQDFRRAYDTRVAPHDQEPT
jgi:FHA domain-containing protein